MFAVVVTSQTEQDQPFGAVVKFPMVTVTVQLVACARKNPAVAPPVRDVGAPQPVAVKVVPAEI